MKYIYTIFYLLFTLLLGACTENTFLNTPLPDTPDEGDLEPVSLNLQSLPVHVIGEEWEAQPATRVSTDTRESLISNIWVFQYSSTNNLITAPRYYTVSDASNMKIMLRPAQNSKVYILANTNNNTWADRREVPTVEELNKQIMTFNNESDVYGGSNMNLLMIGNIDVDIIAGNDNNITINLKRMVAKINFQYKFSNETADKLDITKIVIINVPNTIKVGESTPLYPTSLAACSYNEITSPQPETTYTWYVPENLQGTTSNTDERTKNEGVPPNALAIQLYIDSELDGSNYIYTVYPGENTVNDFNIKRNHFYNVSLLLNSAVTDSRVMAAPANCFVLIPKSSIIFDPYERSERAGGYVYSDYVNKTNNKITSVKILWQTGDGNKFAIGNNSNGSLVYLDSNDKIHVTAGETNGNAVIAAYNSRKEIVWSWHIWVNSNMPAQISKAVPYTTYAWDDTGIKSDNPNIRVEGRAVMSCNLGALATTPGAKAYGLLYQWGRKDPFPQASEDYRYAVYSYSSPYIVTVYDNAGAQITMSGADTGELFQTIMTNSTTGTIGYTTKNPTHFIKSSNERAASTPSQYINDGDWYWGHDDHLWGGKPVSEATKKFETDVPHKLLLANNGATEKSIFDPCPAGWMLGPGDMWLGFTRTGFNAQGNDNSVYNLINCSETTIEENKNNFGYHIYMHGWKTGPTVYFPSQGLRAGNGLGSSNGVCGNYHTSTPGEGGTVYIFHIHTAANLLIFEESYSYTRRSVGGAVRCVREAK